MSNLSREALSGEFRRFGSEEVYDSSPLYEKLSLSIAEDPEILALAAHAREGERVPNLFFAAAQFLLLKDAQDWGSVFSRDDPYPKFRSFCRERKDEIRGLISSGLVQTNEVGRCAFLAPAFVSISRRAQGRPLYLIELGTSAGLNLLWDRYGYQYGEVHRGGNSKSPVQITCALKGNVVPAVPEKFPQVAGRVGVDLSPIDVRDADAALWLRAFVWPEHEKRAKLLEHAIRIARKNPPRLVAGDASAALPAILRDVPIGAVACVFRTFVALPAQSREEISKLCPRYGAERDLFVLSTRARSRIDSELRLVSFIGGIKNETALAYCDNHGRWVEWLGGD
jgi:hypothetical protein